MKFIYKGEKTIIIPELGRVRPGQEFDVENEKLLPIFEALFEKVEESKIEEVKEDE